MTARNLTPGEMQGCARSDAPGAGAISSSYDPDTVSLVIWSLFICLWLLVPVICIAIIGRLS